MSKQRVWWIVGVMGLGTAVALLPSGWLQQVLAFGLLWVLPIPSVVSFLGGRLKPQQRLQSPSTRAEEGEDWLIAAGLVLLIQPLLALIIHYLPGSIPTWSLLLIAILLPLFLSSSPSLPRPPAPPPLFLFPLLLALLLRLPNMAYKEIQGDEGVILVRAAAALLGDDGALFLHQKGPMEILLPLVMWGVTGALNEFWARLPFLWAGLLGVAAVMLLARRWFNGRTALIAGFLLAIMGFGIAFSRIIQYQTLVMLWGMLALLCATRYGAERRRGDLVLTAVFLAAGLLAHYDAVLVVLAVGWVLLKKGSGDWRVEIRDWVVAGALGVGVLGLFYVPFALNPNFGRTFRYLLNDRVGAADGTTGWSGSAVWQMMTFYNSTYYIVGLMCLLLVGVWLLWRRREGATAVLHFLVPALFYIFVVSDPRTHVYTIFPGAIILAAVGVSHLTTDYALRTTHYTQVFIAIIGCLWFALSTNYVYLLFVDVTPERQRNWLAERPSLYPTTWNEPPRYGLFGFPHQAGWREVSAILGDDFGPYASNEEKEITNWYVKQVPRTHCANFDKFIWVANAQDQVAYDPAWLQNLQAEVVVNGAVTLQVYGREAVATVARVVVEGNGRSPFYTPAQIAPATYSGMNPVDITFGNQVRLLGYDMDDSQAHPGGQVWITLYWQPLAPLARNYQVFTHLYDGQMRGQHDGAPECAQNPTTRWEPGQIIADPHLIPIAADASETAVPLLVGMYDLLDQQRLAVPNSADNSLHLTDVWLGDKE